MATFTQRVLGTARLQAAAYEEVEADPHALPQAMGVVVLSAVASGVGTGSAQGAPNLLLDTGLALVGWFVWAWLTYIIGAKFLPAKETQADLGQLLRTTGFASAPGILRVLAVYQPLTAVVMTVASAWMLAAFVVAVRQALDYASWWRTLLVCLIGWIGYVILLYYLTAPLLAETARLTGSLAPLT